MSASMSHLVCCVAVQSVHLDSGQIFWEPEIEMTGKVPKSNDTNLNMESLWNTLKHKMTVSRRFTSSHHDRNFRVDFFGRFTKSEFCQ